MKMINGRWTIDEVMRWKILRNQNVIDEEDILTKI